MLSDSDVIKSEIFENAKNHGKKVLKLSYTSFSGIINWLYCFILCANLLNLT